MVYYGIKVTFCDGMVHVASPLYTTYAQAYNFGLDTVKGYNEPIQFEVIEFLYINKFEEEK